MTHAVHAIRPIGTIRSDSDRRAGALAVLAGWVESQPMRELVNAFGEPWPRGTLAELLDELEVISARHWDFRGRNDNSERWEAESPDLPDNLVSLIYHSGRQLGLVEESSPIRKTYDAVAVLGGGRQTPLVRARFLAELIERGEVSTERIYLLGSPRLLLDSERPLTDGYAKNACTEFDLMNAAGEYAFGLSAFVEEGGSVGESDHAFAQWLVRRYSKRRPQVTSISAPSSNLARRPNTGDTYEWLMHHGDLVRGEQVLLVTSAWFTAFQGFDAMRLLDLGHGLSTEVVGFGVRRAPEQLSPTVLLQEVRSGIRSAHHLFRAAAIG